MSFGPYLLTYIGPETVVPVTSALAALGGLLLMFGGYVRRAAGKCVRLIVRR